MRTVRYRRVAAGAVVTVWACAIAACGGSGGASSAGAATTSEPATTTTIAATTTTSFSPTTVPTSQCDPDARATYSDGPAKPGCSYRFRLGDVTKKNDLEASLTTPSNLGDGWTQVGDTASFGFYNGELTVGATALWVTQMAATPFAKPGELRPMVDDYLAMIAALPGVTVSAPAAITIAGMDGRVVRVKVGTLPPEAATAACVRFDRKPCLMLDATSASANYMNQGSIAEIAVVDSLRGKLLLMWTAPGDTPSSMTDALAASLRSLTLR